MHSAQESVLGPQQRVAGVVDHHPPSDARVPKLTPARSNDELLAQPHEVVFSTGLLDDDLVLRADSKNDPL